MERTLSTQSASRVNPLHLVAATGGILAAAQKSSQGQSLATPPFYISMANRWLLMFVCVLCLCVPLKGQNITLEIPFEIASHSFGLLESVGGGSDVSRSLTLLGYGSGVGTIAYSADMTFENGGGYTLWDYTTGLFVTGQASPGSWLSADLGSLAYQGGWVPFAVNENRLGHVFVVYFPSMGYAVTTTTGGLVGMDTQDSSGNVIWQSFGFFNAWASIPVTDFYSLGNWKLIDVTTGQVAQDNVSNLVDADLVGGGWSTLGGGFPAICVGIFFPDGQNYTLHTGGGSLQSLTPVWTNMTRLDGTPISGYYATGWATIGDTFWATRDVDLSASPTISWPFSGYVDFSQSIPPYVQRSLATYTFQIGQDRFNHNIAVIHADGYKTYLDWSNGITWSNYLVTWDDVGQQVTYYYELLPGQVDTNQSWYLVDEDTNESFGQTQTLMTGWHPWHPNPPSGSVMLTIPVFRRDHALRLRQGDGDSWPLNIDPQYQDAWSYLSAWNYVFSGTPDQRWVEIKYVPASAFTSSSVWWAEDNSVGDGAPSWQLDLSQWYPPPSSLLLKVPISRWAHELYVHTMNGEEFPITRGQVQGGWSQVGNQSYFTGYGFFDATSQYHPETSFWLWDATTNEAAPENTSDLTYWTSPSDATDSDSDGLPDWYEFIVGTAMYDSDTDHDGLNDYQEYQYGGNPFLRDGDQDGVADSDEVNAGTNPAKKDNPLVRLSVFGFAQP